LSLFCLAGFLLNTVEFIIRFFGKSVCEKESCKIVMSYVKYGDIILVLGGIIVFLILFLASLPIETNQNFSKIFPLVFDSLLAISITAEGFLVGFQVFRVKTYCSFCFTVFMIFLSVLLLRILQKRLLPFIGLINFGMIFSLMFLISSPLQPNKCLPESSYTLIYSKNCPHCKRVMKFLDSKSVKYTAIPAEKNKEFLNMFQINNVPILIIRSQNEVKIVTGEEKIKSLFDFNFNNQKNNLPFLPNQSDSCKIGAPCK